MIPILNAMASPWTPTMLLVAASLLFRLRSGTWFSPSAFAGLLWSVYLCCSVMAIESRTPAMGVWVMASLVLVVQAAASFAEFDPRRAVTPLTPVDPERTSRLLARVRQACWIFNLVSLVGCTYFIFSSFDYFKLSLSLDSLVRLGGLWTLQRYNNVMDPWPLRIAAIWPYPAALLGGVLKSLAIRRRDKILAILSLIPALSIGLLLGGRAGFLLSLTFWFGAYWATERACTGRDRKLFSSQNLMWALGLAGGLLFFFLFVFALRDLADSSKTELILVANSGQMRNYMFGSPAAFSQWFDNGDRGPLGWGAFSFPGFFDVTGLRPRTIGTYTDFANTTGLEVMNIYTIFRGLIQDFSFPGTILVCAVFGFISGRAYSRPSLSANFVLCLSAYYSVVLFSPLCNIFGFNSSILAWVATGWVLRQSHPHTSVLNNLPG